MLSFDLDIETQKIINKLSSELPLVEWVDWLEINSKEDYLDYVLKHSGLNNVDNIFTKVKMEKTESTSFSINKETLLEQANKEEPLILCHTSGTTDSRTSALKWFQISISNIKRTWAPGMKAIFESSGLNKNNSVVIFVPSRLEVDGLNEENGKKYISCYSSEFSQRIMLSIIKPSSYSLFEYKKANNLEVLSKILSLEEIAVISAPAITILKWADINKFKAGLENSFKSIKNLNNPQLEGLLKIIKSNTLTDAARKIQLKLSEKLRNATLVFSISSLSEDDWILIRKFMNWEKGAEKFTNLYVASEIGPIASSLGDLEISRANQMYILPLSLPVLERKRVKEILSYSKEKIGKLLVSRMEDDKPLVNIDIGDVINIKSQERLPLIDGIILRDSFLLKYPISISQKIKIPQKYNVLAGDYFDLPSFKIYRPRNLLECLNKENSNSADSLLLLIDDDNLEERKLFLPLFNNYLSSENEKITECIRSKIKDNLPIKFEFIDDKPVNFVKERSDMINKVRTGKIPKGILKKWPLYVITRLN
ncbi:MAG: hypothetical protein HWN80_02230 [Candidatus Lokiarchaeota archaeon]|nr:hypothetical protein [Candidatus Lokiarchaeota archaeon]